MATTVELLRGLAIFRELSDEELAKVAELAVEKSYAAGEHIFHEGEPGNRLFVIVAGQVRISRQIPGAGEEALAVLDPGAMFGEMSVFDRSERSTDAIAHVATRLITIARPEFEMLLDFDRDLAQKVLWAVVRMLSARLRATNESLRSVMALSMF
ncbi:MAG TPA: cyclic nucleotide-binding domain-containing protein [Gemmatimonadaceae bacterium]